MAVCRNPATAIRRGRYSTTQLQYNKIEEAQRNKRISLQMKMIDSVKPFKRNVNKSLLLTDHDYSLAFHSTCFSTNRTSHFQMIELEGGTVIINVKTIM